MGVLLQFCLLLDYKVGCFYRFLIDILIFNFFKNISFLLLELEACRWFICCKDEGILIGKFRLKEKIEDEIDYVQIFYFVVFFLGIINGDFAGNLEFSIL